MLPRNRRISRKEFQHIITLGKRYYSSHLVLQISGLQHKNTPQDSRFSFSVSKKVCKKAVDRNRLRRRGYSIIAKYMSKIKPGFYCLFSFKTGSSAETFSNLEKEIAKLLSEAFVIS